MCFVSESDLQAMNFVSGFVLPKMLLVMLVVLLDNGRLYHMCVIPIFRNYCRKSTEMEIKIKGMTWDSF